MHYLSRRKRDVSNSEHSFHCFHFPTEHFGFPFITDTWLSQTTEHMVLMLPFTSPFVGLCSAMFAWKYNKTHLNPFTPRVRYGVFKVILTSESVDEILWCDHLNETSLAVLSHGTIYILKVFYKMKFRIRHEFWFQALLGVKGLTCLITHCLN